MDEENGSDQQPNQAEIETTEARREPKNTAAKRKVRGRDRTKVVMNGKPVETTLETRRRIAVGASSCPNCGITKGGHPDLIHSYKSDGPILRMKCKACGTTWKITVD